MSSKRAVRRRACLGKPSYKTFAEAMPEAERLWSKGEKVRPYQCRFCNKFHIGHVPWKARRKLAAKKRRSVRPFVPGPV